MRPYTTVTVVVEIPKGSRNKYEWDERLKGFRYDRMLFSSVHYPADYGFIPDTLAEDGDTLDALVLVTEPTFTGCIIEAKPVGLFKMWDEKGVDDKILCVPVGDTLWNYIDDIEEVPPHLLNEIGHFFDVYKDLEAKRTSIEGWEGRETAIRSIETAKDRHLQRPD
ncbi:MAG: inorganic diphosphatase [Actinobacteria bacterium]|nr:inorganic diphosphatase [Chloroflexota bacterium]MCL5292624.1 inorganic diphosphatase [Actinomycetota bacterium]